MEQQIDLPKKKSHKRVKHTYVFSCFLVARGSRKLSKLLVLINQLIESIMHLSVVSSLLVTPNLPCNFFLFYYIALSFFLGLLPSLWHYLSSSGTLPAVLAASKSDSAISKHTMLPVLALFSACCAHIVA